MKEVIITPGTHIEYTTTKKAITFGDEDLTINLKNREKDEKVLIDVCADRDGELVIGAATGYKYVAQVEIPSREYAEEQVENLDYDPEAEEGSSNASEYITERQPVPFDIDNCTIYLFAID